MDAVRAERMEGHSVGLRRCETAVLVHDVPYVDVLGKGRLARVGRRGDRGELGVPAANRVDDELEEVRGRQLVAVLDDRRLVLDDTDGRPEIAHADRLVAIARVLRPVAPHIGRTEVPVELPGARAHRELVVVRARIGGGVRDGRLRCGQRVDELLQRRGLRNRGVRRRRFMTVMMAGTGIGVRLCPLTAHREHGRTPGGPGHEEIPSPDHRLQPSVDAVCPRRHIALIRRVLSLRAGPEGEAPIQQ